jgi:crotonobetainyl-CoA:carnitine CoA-transferase CaiB-like acyl-CoA transferase
MSGPLDGFRVLDLGQLIAGPWAATMLADQGADVIKLERPGVGDLFRYVGSSRGGMSGMFHLLNRGKRSLALDLARPEGVEVFLELARGADVIVQNLRPGVVERLGIGYEQVRAVRDDIVYLSLSGFGPEGPYAQRGAYDNVIQSYSGLADAQADPETGKPEFVRQLLTDKLTAWAGAQAATAALLARALGRGGQHVELSMLATAIAFLWPDRAGHRILQGEGIDEQPPLGPNFKLLELADGFGTATAFTDAEFAGLCRALGLAEVAADPLLSSTAARMQNFDHMTATYRDKIGPAAAKLDRQSFERELVAQDVPHGVVRSIDELHADPHVVATGLFAERDHAVAGRLREPRHPARFHGTPLDGVGDAPTLGQHSDQILAEFGLAGRTAELRAAGVVG